MEPPGPDRQRLGSARVTPKTLVVTNDFPPRQGGIQSFVHALAAGRPPGSVVVYAPIFDGAAGFDARQPFPVIRHRSALMLPTPRVLARAREIVTEFGCDTVLFGAAAPLGLLAPGLRRAGIKRCVALTHGHEAGWAMLPAARGLLRRIGDGVDVITYLGDYSKARLERALSPAAAARMIRLAPGVDAAEFRPGRGGERVRDQLGLGRRPVVICVSRLVPRKGQDTLIRAWPLVKAAVPDAGLLLVCGGRYRGALDGLAEGLGIVYLAAAESGLPVIAGDSGGAPDAVVDGQTGYVVDGRSVEAVARYVSELLTDRERAVAMGEKGRAWILDEWRWELVAQRLEAVLAGGP